MYRYFIVLNTVIQPQHKYDILINLTVKLFLNTFL